MNDNTAIKVALAADDATALCIKDFINLAMSGVEVVADLVEVGKNAPIQESDLNGATIYLDAQEEPSVDVACDVMAMKGGAPIFPIIAGGQLSLKNRETLDVCARNQKMAVVWQPDFDVEAMRRLLKAVRKKVSVERINVGEVAGGFCKAESFRVAPLFADMFAQVHCHLSKVVDIRSREGWNTLCTIAEGIFMNTSYSNYRKTKIRYDFFTSDGGRTSETLWFNENDVESLALKVVFEKIASQRNGFHEGMAIF